MQPLDKKFILSLKQLNINNNNSIAIACSGGPDSMALCLLARAWAKARKNTITALIVDHGLRKESSGEARKVAGWLKKKGILSVILPWKGRKPIRNIQESARKARYMLMSDYCKSHGIAHLLVGHHLEDQAETFLLRLARGSGVDGLAAMAPVTGLYGITLVRPLLNFTKQELLEYLKKARQAFIRDPSNENPAFDRVKIRTLMPTLAEVGITPDRLVKTAANMARARAHLEKETGVYLKKNCDIYPEGYARLQQAGPSQEIALRVLSTLIMLVGGALVKTRLSDLERLHAALNETAFKGATLGGCVFTRHKDAIVIYRELKSVASPRTIKPGRTLTWDNRFELTLGAGAPRVKVGALTQSGWLTLAKTHALKNPAPNKNILYCLPALRDGTDHIIAVPHLGYATDDSVKCTVKFIPQDNSRVLQTPSIVSAALLKGILPKPARAVALEAMEKAIPRT